MSILFCQFRKAPEGSPKKFKAQKQFLDMMSHRMHIDHSMMLIGKLLFGYEKGPKVLKTTRKRDVILKFAGSDASNLFGTFVKVRQTQNSFPFGSCINRTNIDNEDFVDFFVKNFNWVVFGNELKWPWTETQQGNFNYKDADEMLDLCKSHNIEISDHCIFWEVKYTIQSWVRSLNKNDLMIVVQNRLNGLLTRNKGKFRHYDVNNEMLHGSFYQDRLGKDTRSYMFKIAHQLDTYVILFVNDYHVEDGDDTRSSPEKYIEHILDLQEQGAPAGGIGIQGHIDSPVGDVSSINEHVLAAGHAPGSLCSPFSGRHHAGSS
ncbi:PREDICTED: uncharacterized protein LOC104599608 [Nelumbo nucifera]|uniref:Uncharacterized protein LOC104599608 n=1 Tax=Nelumbo nucifera TaxID=4432 RepID=A0A1U8A6G1_NELNU|nr:PREDICTED: uncharacterized protein LOC104599608 [Nelumbo nucifera]